ncbi:MAG: Mrp/NBP35 family ATP-binding protein [Methermicoccaceae archaeon]
MDSKGVKQTDDMEKAIAEKLSSVRYRIAIMSGKGGVGKSTTTANLAVILTRRGYKVGVFDYDFHGPAIPRMLGVSGELLSDEDKVIPPEGAMGIKVFSIGLLLSDERSPVIWRGPMKYNVLRQFLSKLEWGNLDFLLFDLPPGTGDEALNVAQSIPQLDGVVAITIPSEVSMNAVERSIEFSKRLNLRLLGLIENMSYLVCPKCSEKIPLFGEGGGDKIVEDEGVRLFGKVPMDPKLAQSMDAGNPLLGDESESIRVFEEISDALLDALGEDVKR